MSKKKATYRFNLKQYEIDVKNYRFNHKDNLILQELLTKSEIVGFCKARLGKKIRKQAEEEYKEFEEKIKYWW
jgi:hypothetical protein